MINYNKVTCVYCASRTTTETSDLQDHIKEMNAHNYKLVFGTYDSGYFTFFWQKVY